MDGSSLSKMIIQWLHYIREKEIITNVWTNAKDMFKLFCDYYYNRSLDTITYQSFLRKLNSIHPHIEFMRVDYRFDSTKTRSYSYFISCKIKPSHISSPPTINRTTKTRSIFNPHTSNTPHSNNTFNPQLHYQTSNNNDSRILLTPKETIHHDNIVTTRTTSEMSTNTLTSLPNKPSPVSVVDSPSTTQILPTIETTFKHNTPHQYPVLSQYGIPTDLSTSDSMSTIQSLLRELECLGKSNDLFFSAIK